MQLLNNINYHITTIVLQHYITEFYILYLGIVSIMHMHYISIRYRH